jgi:hypothetical protein
MNGDNDGKGEKNVYGNWFHNLNISAIPFTQRIGRLINNEFNAFQTVPVTSTRSSVRVL